MLGRMTDAEAEVVAGQSARPDRPWWTLVQARLEMVRQNFDRAIELMAGNAAGESSPSAWLFGRIVPLKMAGRDADARVSLGKLNERFPGFCDAEAIGAGLDWDAGNRPQALKTADAIVTRASAPGAPPGLLPCAAAAAAATGDGPQAASVLAKMTFDERALRAWTRETVFSASLTFRLRLYPWNKVQASGPMSQASSALADSLERLRDETARRLPTPEVKPARQSQ
jgi:hypothetical protein